MEISLYYTAFKKSIDMPRESIMDSLGILLLQISGAAITRALPQMIMDLALSEESMANIVVDYDCEQGQSHPNESKGKAYLAHDIKRKIAVVPHIPSKTEIDDGTGNELNTRDADTTNNHLRNDTDTVSEHAVVDGAHKKKSEPTNDSHGPVSISTIHDLDHGIYHGTKEEEEQDLDAIVKDGMSAIFMGVIEKSHINQLLM